MKKITGLLAMLLLIFLTGFASSVTAKSMEEGAAAKNKWYPHIVDGAFVEQYATLPRPKDALVIDARPKSRKYDKGHIPGAVSIPEMKFDKMTDQLPQDKATMLIFYCGGEKCMLSHKSAFKAEKLGYTNIKVYAAGYPDWKKRGNLIGVDVAHIKKLIDKQEPVVIIDSRPKKRKYDKGHIPGAISIPDMAFDKMTDKLPADKATPLYFYCGGYKCKLSPNSAAKAKKLGYKKVFVVPAGYPAWKKAYGGMAKKAAPAIEKGKEEGSISLASFNKIMKDSPESLLVVDVRDPEEFATGAMTGSVNIPINALEKKMGTLPKDKAIVFVCGTGGRSGEAYDMIQTFEPSLKTYFLNAEITFNKDGSYVLKPLE